MMPNYSLQQMTDAVVLVHGTNPQKLKNAHTDDFVQFFFCFSGSISVTVDSDSFVIGRDEVAFVLPGQVHRYSSSPDNEGYVIGMEAILVPPAQYSMMRSLAVSRAPQHLPAAAEFRDDLRMLFPVIEKVLAMGAAGRSTSLWLASSVIVMAFGLGRAVRNGDSDGLFTLFQSFENLMKQDETLAGSAEDCARILRVAPAELSAAVRRYSAATVKGYMMNSRADMARRFLVYSSSPVSDIAARLGFRDSSYFARFFRKRVGMSPTEYREKYRLC